MNGVKNFPQASLIIYVCITVSGYLAVNDMMAVCRDAIPIPVRHTDAIRKVTTCKNPTPREPRKIDKNVSHSL